MNTPPFSSLHLSTTLEHLRSLSETSQGSERTILALLQDKIKTFMLLKKLEAKIREFEKKLAALSVRVSLLELRSHQGSADNTTW